MTPFEAFIFWTLLVNSAVLTWHIRRVNRLHARDNRKLKVMRFQVWVAVNYAAFYPELPSFKVMVLDDKPLTMQSYFPEYFKQD